MILNAHDVTVRFGGVVAVDRVSIGLNTGSICAVIGPNGSGKSTLFNAFTGLVPCSEGQISIDGEVLANEQFHRRVKRKISRTFQTPRFDSSMSTRDAVLCGYFPRRRIGSIRTMLGLPSAKREEAACRIECQALLKTFRLDHLSELPMAELSMGQIRLVDVARAMAAQPKFLLLDEPAAGLSQSEQITLADEIRRVASEGVGVLLVEHNFDLVTRLAESLVVLERGKVLLRGTPDQVRNDATFRRAYLGTEAAN
jgi:ABC-type branched-subunit amino acid transport system ATPase component